MDRVKDPDGVAGGEREERGEQATAEKVSQCKRARWALKNLPIRCVTMDGGGMYGITQAYWLRMLCELDEDFLKPSDQHCYVFSGASAGAVNALLLAQAPDPRAFVMSNELEMFWRQGGFFANEVNATDRRLALIGLRPWLGTQDAMQVLHDQRWFGYRKMEDLHHPVLISAYSWSGERPRFHGAPQQPVMWQGALYQADHEVEPTQDGKQNREARQWQPFFFSNVMRNSDRGYRLADVAFAATAMPPVRAIRGGVGDGGIFNANPSMDTVACIIQALQYRMSGRPVPTNVDHVTAMAEVFRRLSMLSIGNGAVMPYYHARDFEYGPLQWMRREVNSAFGPWTPTSYTLNQPILDAEMDTQTLLFRRYFRLNPGIINVPPGPILYIIRNTRLREMLIQYIQQQAWCPTSRRVVQAAAAFTKGGWRDRGDAPMRVANHNFHAPGEKPDPEEP